MPTKIEKDAVTGTDTTGHEWDGIKELNTPLPKWWLYTFYASILFAIVYSVLYPSVPGLRSHFGGTLGFSQREDVSRSMTAAGAAQAGYVDRIAKASLAEIRGNADLFAFANVGGRAAFNNNCAQCHQTGGAGIKGYPNLADDDWVWGGALDEINQTIQFGVRNTNDKSRQSMMPKFGVDGLLKPAEIEAVADYVMSLSDKAKAASPGAKAGATVFAEQCEACHGKEGIGNRELGAPRLSDKIWLYGGDRATIIETITKSRAGAMPAWGERLDPATIKMLTVYVHGLGGGE